MRSKVVYSLVSCCNINTFIHEVLTPFTLVKHGEIEVGNTNWIMSQQVYCKKNVLDNILQNILPEIKEIININWHVFFVVIMHAVKENIDKEFL